jgi:hypothetical protein
MRVKKSKERKNTPKAAKSPYRGYETPEVIAINSCFLMILGWWSLVPNMVLIG